MTRTVNSYILVMTTYTLATFAQPLVAQTDTYTSSHPYRASKALVFSYQNVEKAEKVKGDTDSAVHGTITAVDEENKVLTIETVAGNNFTITVVDSTVLHGSEDNKDVWHGLKKGSEIIAHGVKKGSKFTAVELDRVGKGGLIATKATLKAVDKSGKVIVVATAKGGQETFHVARKSALSLAQNTAAGTKVVIYSTEEAGKKIAHFFEPQAKS